MSARPLGRHIKHTRHNPCPVCGEERCLSFADGAVLCLRVGSDHPTSSGIGWMHWPNGRPDAWPDRLLVPVQGREPSPALPPADLSPIYERLTHLPETTLTAEHRADLTRRGMTPEQIGARGYASLPRRGRSRIGRTLVSDFGSDIIGRVPGLFLGRQGNVEAPYPTIAGADGLITPIVDLDGWIVGLNVRRNREAGSGPKYVILSSNPETPKYAFGGCAAGSPLHVAHPLVPRPEPDPAPSWPRGVPGITEGIIKSNIASDRLGEIVLGMPGMNVRRDVVPTLQRLGATQAIIALDNDPNPTRVRQAEDALAQDLVLAGVTPLLASWPSEHKGIDDALAADAPITVDPFPPERIRIRPGMVIATDPPAARPRPLRSLDEARAQLAVGIEAALADLGSEQPRMLQVVTDPGVGKTRAFAYLIRRWHADGWPQRTVKRHGVPMAEPLRVLFLAPTKDLCAEVFNLLPPGLAMLQQGRNPDPQHAWGCLEPERIAAAGNGRHNPHADVCETCADRHGWPRGVPGCHYLQAKTRIEDATVVVAPADSYINGSSELAKFDLIVFDEGIFGYLLEEVVIDRARVAAWRVRMNQLDIEQPGELRHGELVGDARYPESNPFRRLINALDMLQARCPAAGVAMSPALPDLREILPDLPAIITAILAVPLNESSKRYPFETPELWEEEQRRLVPLRAIRDLADAIHDEIGRPDGADTRLWKTAAGLLLLRPRQHIIDILRKKKLVNLDATPHPSLRFFLPEPEVLSIDAPRQQHVTQITDLLGSGTELRGPHNHARIEAVVERLIAGSERPVVFARKEFAPGEAAPLAVSHPAVRFGWYDNQNRGVNAYEDTDVLILVGRYSHPIDRTRAEVQAARFTPVPAASGERLDLLCYDWRGPDGHGYGRYTRADADPDVNAAIRWSESAPILQAAGRGRAVNRPPERPLRIYYLSNLPISGLTVDALTTLDELGAPPSRRGTNEAFQAQAAVTAARSILRGAETTQRVEQAIAELEAEGAGLTPSEIARRAGIRRPTLYENEGVRAIVEEAMARQAVVGGVRAGLDNEYSLSHPTRTAPTTPLTPVSVDPSEAQRALAAADAAHDRPAFRQANTELADRLAELARARGREPLPHPVGGGSHPPTPPSVHLWQRADLPDAGLGDDGTPDRTRAAPGGI